MNRTEPNDPLSRLIIARNERHNEPLNQECIAPQHGFDEGAELRMLLEPRIWTDEEGNARTCPIEDRAKLDSRYNMRNLAQEKRKPKRFRRLRALLRIERNTGLWLLAMALLFVAGYLALRAF